MPARKRLVDRYGTRLPSRRQLRVIELVAQGLKNKENRQGTPDQRTRRQESSWKNLRQDWRKQSGRTRTVVLG